MNYWQLIPLLLRLYWILAAGSVLVTILPGVHVPLSFKNAVRLSAARGKLWQANVRSLGPLSEVTVPQQWFGHFYALGAACNLTVTLTLLNMMSSPLSTTCTSCHSCDGSTSTLVFLLLGMLQLHLVRRLVETYCIMVYPPGAHMHIIAYAFGISYYAVVPLSLLPQDMVLELSKYFLNVARNMVEAVIAALLRHNQDISDNGGNMSHGAIIGEIISLVKESPKIVLSLITAAIDLFLGMDWVSVLLQYKLMLLMGLAIFLSGNIIQCWSHTALARLSKRSFSKYGTDTVSHYLIPHGGLFELVSCPHYFGEVLIYLGLLLLAEGRVNAWLMLGWVVLNLVLAANATHAWYINMFPDTYPRERKALVPLIW
ncbi:hypothetical protein CEUSTIGMA_g7859.t1 [Chlamydomonas eustigma]|uniref:3-oxo-5-alpha-steroid 4-dehydrogenase C-terminal domain-containing protein n=1 Tax=Chlamydomonas eustigma TaxID=1157962 RepID=A0A250XCD1_9CHLO|nr:hypothetical protein CEUSTIGMA_g7859.t1 [Chlamydomonas eustigma]|eukprot:GAX80420.1 hypothetical protein CEUSTIGMA_g7859.t1 [Chlamydomonas eustigma]